MIILFWCVQLLNQVLVLRKKPTNINVNHNILCCKDDKKDYLGKETYSIYTQIDESHTESDQIWWDPTIRRNPIGIRVTESLKKFSDPFLR